MEKSDPQLDHLENLRRWRTVGDRDHSLGFLKQLFNRQVARPFKQLQAIVPLWQSLVPPELADHARLERLSRGVLHVAVDSSSHLYELDRMLRGGLERQMIGLYKGPGLRRIMLRLGGSDSTERH